MPGDQNSSSQLSHVAQEMYKKNRELAETNQTLLLLRRIDEIVLSTLTDKTSVLQKIAEVLVVDSVFNFVIIYVRNHSKRTLIPEAMVYQTKNSSLEEKAKSEFDKPITLRHEINHVVRATNELRFISTRKLYEVVQPNLPFDEAEKLQDEMGLETFYACPLVTRREVVGALVLGSSLSDDILSSYQKNLLERLAGAVGVALDNTLLYAQTKESARRLRAANDRLKDLDKAKDEFITLASHQLRTPLTTIKGYLSMLEDGDAGRLTKLQAEFVKEAYGGSKRMVSLIADLLNVSRMSSGKFQIDRTPVDLIHIVAQEVRQLQTHAHAKDLKLKFVPPAKPLPVMSLDEIKTRQVLMNFIDNAIYYTKKGSITVSLAKLGNEVELLVEDTGIGVPKEAREKLFAKFYRADNAQNVRPDGTGLGLYLAKRVIEDQGGSIFFESKEGKGSTFGFRLPMDS